NPVRQLEGGGSAHSGEPYLATLNRTSASALRKSGKPWSGGLAAGFLGLISAPGGRPPPTAQPRSLPGTLPRTLPRSLPGGLLRSGLATRLRAGFRRADLAARPGPAPPPPGRAGCLGRPVAGARPVPATAATAAARAAGAPARGPAPGRADLAGLADVLDGLGL